MIFGPRARTDESAAVPVGACQAAVPRADNFHSLVWLITHNRTVSSDTESSDTDSMPDLANLLFTEKKKKGQMISFPVMMVSQGNSARRIRILCICFHTAPIVENAHFLSIAAHLRGSHLGDIIIKRFWQLFRETDFHDR